MNERQSQNLLLKVDPLSTTCNNKLNTQGEKLETAKLRVFVSGISSLPSIKAAIYEIRFFFSRIPPPLEHSARYSFRFVVYVRWTACVQRKFEGLY